MRQSILHIYGHQLPVNPTPQDGCFILAIIKHQNWAKGNNLKLNCDKSCEAVFTDSSSRRRHAAEAAPLPGIVRCSSLKILGVVIADDFSVTQHVQRLVTSSAQTNYARVLRCHGLDNAALQHVYRATVVASLTYTPPAHGAVSPKLLIASAVIDRARRLGYCSLDLGLLTFDAAMIILCDTADHELLKRTELLPRVGE